jgi:ATP-dependent RNA helicase DDX24/MAK5
VPPAQPSAPAAAADEPQQQRKKGGKARNPWAAATGWKSVDVNDELILGAEEFGFAGLEVMEDTSLIDPGE